MSTIKISQLPAKGANLEATDLVEISEFNGSGYVSKSITGQEIIDAASGSGVTSVTASAPLHSSGGSTPDITIDASNAFTDGYLTSTDYQYFATKQEELVSGVNIKTLNGGSLLGSGGLSVQPTLVSGTNIKTINGNTLLGSGDLTISSGGGAGIHVIAKPYTGMGICLHVTQANSTTIAASQQQLVFYPFIPANNVTINQIVIEVTTAVAGSNSRITIYSDVNGRPNTRTFQSASIDTSTTGYKTITTTQSFTAGTTYWIGFCVSTSGVSFRATPAANTYAISYSNGTGSLSVQNQFVYLVTTAPGSEPLTISTASLSWSGNPIININMRVA